MIIVWPAAALVSLLLNKTVSIDIKYGFQYVLIITPIYIGIVLWLFQRFANISYYSFGLRRSDHKDGFRFWMAVELVFILALMLIRVVEINIMHIKNVSLVIGRLSFYDSLNGLIYSPIVEEFVFRGVVCSTLAVIMGWKQLRIILISGALFACAHYVYGNAGPANFVCGYFFAWVFCRTRTLTMPVLFHSFSNLFLLTLSAIIQHYYPRFEDFLNNLSLF